MSLPLPPALAAIGFDAHFQTRLAALDGAFTPARIAIAHGESYVAWTEQGQVTAIIKGHRGRLWREAVDRPQVGDWVAGSQPEAGGPLLIEHVLERRTCLMRRAAGERITAQVIAANIDVVGIVSAFGEAAADARSRRLVSERRLQRYLSAVEQSGAQAVLIMNKCDLGADVVSVAAELREQFPSVPLLLTSGATRVGLDSFDAWLGPGKTMALVGMSGVGKSTLVNALLGRSAQHTQAVRESDARGRHTTTHRELFVLENRALLIDTPGMRELGVWDEAASAGAFDDVAAIAGECRFSNCHHQSEPDCAIRDALQSGRLPADRWATYQLHRTKQAGPQQHQRGAVGRSERAQLRSAPPRRGS